MGGARARGHDRRFCYGRGPARSVLAVTEGKGDWGSRLTLTTHAVDAGGYNSTRSDRSVQIFVRWFEPRIVTDFFVGFRCSRSNCSLEAVEARENTLTLTRTPNPNPNANREASERWCVLDDFSRGSIDRKGHTDGARRLLEEPVRAHTLC